MTAALLFKGNLRAEKALVWSIPAAAPAPGDTADRTLVQTENGARKEGRQGVAQSRAPRVQWVTMDAKRAVLPPENNKSRGNKHNSDHV